MLKSDLQFDGLMPAGAAFRCGLRKGDVIEKLNDTAWPSAEQVTNVQRLHTVDQFKVTVSRY